MSACLPTRTRKAQRPTICRTTCPRAVKTKRRNILMAEQKRIVGRAQKTRVGAQVKVMIDGPSPEHELVWRGRLAGQAPDIDPVVYLTEADPDLLRAGALRDAEIVGARDYDLVARLRGESRYRRGRRVVISFWVCKSLQDLKWAGAHFLFLRVCLRSSLREFAPSPSGSPARTTWKSSTCSSAASPPAGYCGFLWTCRGIQRRLVLTKPGKVDRRRVTDDRGLRTRKP